MTDTTDIISFVRKQMPNFGSLSSEQKQQVLKQFEPAYKQAYRSLQVLKSRGVAPASALSPAPESTSPFSTTALKRGPQNPLEKAQDDRLATERAQESPAVSASPVEQGDGAFVPRRETATSTRMASTPPATKAAAEPTREDMESREYDRIQAFRKREGLGAARQEMRQFLSDENNKLTEQFGRDRMMAFAEAGFKMAAAASRPGATFLGALAEGAMSGTQALRGIQKEMDANRRGLKESMLKLREAEELEKEGDFKSAMQIAQQARTEMLQRQQHEDKLKVDYAQIAATVENSRRSAGATIRAAEIGAASRADLAGMKPTPGAITPETEVKNRLAVLKNRADSLTEYINSLRGFDLSPTEKAAYDDARRELAGVERERDQLTRAGGAPVTATTSLTDPLGIR